MNGVRKNNREIEQFVTSHNIVLENLCNFLLQEKVAEFGKLAGEPPKLLRHLEAAVGPPGMLDDHDHLITLAGRKNDSEREHRDKQEQLAHLTSQKASMQEEIARLDQLNAILESIRLLELKIPMLKVQPRAAASRDKPAARQ
jgi:structural maintenance of chromosomes protein 5